MKPNIWLPTCALRNPQLHEPSQMILSPCITIFLLITWARSQGCRKSILVSFGKTLLATYPPKSETIERVIFSAFCVSLPHIEKCLNTHISDAQTSTTIQTRKPFSRHYNCWFHRNFMVPQTGVALGILAALKNLCAGTGLCGLPSRGFQGPLVASRWWWARQYIWSQSFEYVIGTKLIMPKCLDHGTAILETHSEIPPDSRIYGSKPPKE